MRIRFNARLAAIGLSAALSVAAFPAFAQVMVGGAPMLASKDIVDNAVNSKNHATLVAAVKAAGLVDTLKSAGPFTVFAPTNAAFGALPVGTVDTLLKPENKPTLALSRRPALRSHRTASPCLFAFDGPGRCSVTAAGRT